MAALYDGSHYLTESHANVVINLASLINLKDKPSSEWTALGLGVSKAHQNWPELRYVPVELKGIIRDEDAGGITGILRGRIMLDEAFTEENLRDALIRQLYRVVHIASHFKFDADGNSNDSFLLLGNGKLTKLTIAQIAAIPNFFAGVELLTLSACCHWQLAIVRLRFDVISRIVDWHRFAGTNWGNGRDVAIRPYRASDSKWIKTNVSAF